MELTSQVCSLELAKKLNELGVKQESAFWYLQLHWGPDKQFEPYYVLNHGYHADVDIQFSAYTVAELGEMLPNLSWCRKSRDGFMVRIGSTHGAHFEHSDTEANARAKMLIYLLENKLITI